MFGDIIGRISSWFGNYPNKRKLLIILLLLIALPITTLAALTVQNLRQRAQLSGSVQMVDVSGNPISTTSDPNVFLKITLPADWVAPPQAQNNLVGEIYAQTACHAETTTCGQPSYGNCTFRCSDGRAFYDCVQTDNPNCQGTIQCSSEDSKCQQTATSTPTPVPVQQIPTTAPVANCQTDCTKCTTVTTCGTKTYDTCVDDKGQSNLAGNLCTNGASRFRCFAKDNTNCTSSSSVVINEYNYSCSACPSSQTPTAMPTTVAATPTQTPSGETPIPTQTIHVLQGLYIENKDADGSGGSAPLRITSNFSEYLNKPIPWRLNDLKEGQTEASQVVQILLFDGQSNIPFTTSITLTRQITPSPIPTTQPTQASSLDTACLPLTALPIPVPVLVLEYYPPDPQNPNLLDGNETGWKQDAQINGRTIKFWEEKTQQMINQGIALINETTKYHGYKNSSAPQFLNYQVIDDKKIYQSIPRGHILEKRPDGDAVRPDYGGILRNLNICDYVDRKGVKEVWMYGYHNDNGIIPDESKMSSKYGDVSNGLPKEEQIEQQYRMPICKNSYVLYNFTYQPTGNPGANLHNRVHQIENVIPFAEGNWPPSVENTKGTTFWGDFAEYIQENSPFVQQGFRISSYRSSCGNGHITPNWNNSKTQGGRYDLQQQEEFNCETWHPDKSKTTYIKAGCERWGCTELGFFKWFMQNMPGYNNGIIYQGKQMRNWWEAMYDFNAFIEQGRSLYGDSIFCSGKVKLQGLPNQSLIPDTSQAGDDQTRLVGDINADGVVDMKDWDILVSQFGQRGTNLSGDLNHDGTVDIFDYNILVENFGKRK